MMVAASGFFTTGAVEGLVRFGGGERSAKAHVEAIPIVANTATLAVTEREGADLRQANPAETMASARRLPATIVPNGGTSFRVSGCGAAVGASAAPLFSSNRFNTSRGMTILAMEPCFADRQRVLEIRPPREPRLSTALRRGPADDRPDGCSLARQQTQ